MTDATEHANEMRKAYYAGRNSIDDDGSFYTGFSICPYVDVALISEWKKGVKHAQISGNAWVSVMRRFSAMHKHGNRS